MFKKFLTTLLSISFVMLFGASANASKNVKTSTKTKVESTQLISQCKKMFNLADTLIRDAERQPGTHIQVRKMKNKLSSTKEQIAKMQSDLQQKSCDKGLTALNTLKQKH